MTPSLLANWAFNWLFGWGGVSLFVALGAGAVWWFIPAIFVKFRALAFNVAIGALAFNLIFTTGYTNGASDTKAAWDAAERGTAERGDKIREEAEQAIPPEAGPDDVVPAPVTNPPSGRVRHHKLDKYDRD
jgi:hypothetical protein